MKIEKSAHIKVRTCRSTCRKWLFWPVGVWSVQCWISRKFGTTSGQDTLPSLDMLRTWMWEQSINVETNHWLKLWRNVVTTPACRYITNVSCFQGTFTIGVRQDFNNRVLRLPAIVLLNTTFRPANSGLLRVYVQTSKQTHLYFYVYPKKARVSGSKRRV